MIIDTHRSVVLYCDETIVQIFLVCLRSVRDVNSESDYFLSLKRFSVDVGIE